MKYESFKSCKYNLYYRCAESDFFFLIFAATIKIYVKIVCKVSFIQHKHGSAELKKDNLEEENEKNNIWSDCNTF